MTTGVHLPARRATKAGTRRSTEAADQISSWARSVILVRRVSTVAGLAHRGGPKHAAREAFDVMCGTRTYVALRCDLADLPAHRPAAIPLEMTSRECPASEVFDAEASTAGATDYLEVMRRRAWCQAGIEQLFVADGPDRRPAYCQWLVRNRDQWRMQELAPGHYAVLRPDEVMLEGAYTFTAFRRKGAMVDAMWQLLRRARDEGARTAITYVGQSNTASLRGCAAVGFKVDHVRRSMPRPAWRRRVALPVDDVAREAWDQALGVGRR